MNRPVLAPLALAALLAAGCIENPGVDPGVGRPDTTRETAHVEATFRGANFLRLRLTLDSGRMSLLASNRGLSTIDSATFLLEATTFHKNRFGWGFDPPADLEFYGKVGSLPPGASAELGTIDSLLPGRLSDYYLEAVAIRVAEDGMSRGCRFGGVFTGRHRIVDTGGKAFEGPLRGVVNADGEFRFAIHQGGQSSPGVLTGMVNDSGAMAAPFSLGFLNPGNAGRLFTRPDGFGGSFTFRDSLRRIDSLDLAYQPYSPR